jgi:hypothetical protein
MARPDADKAQRPAGDKTSITGLTAEIKAAQALLSPEEADAIIGEESDEHRALLAGIRALMSLSWAAMQQRGLRPTPAATQDAGKALIMAVSLVHEAYALGVRRGREEGRG